MSAVDTTELATAPATARNEQAIAAATASASTSFSGKAKRPLVQTSLLAPFPSEMPTPTSAHPPEEMRHDTDFKTPITPPIAYKDFLKKMPAALITPPNSAEPPSRAGSISDASSTGTAINDWHKPSHPADHPGITRNSSTDSSSSYSTVSTSSTDSIPTVAGPSRMTQNKSASPRIVIPPKHFRTRASSARTPRQLYIPASPLSATSARSPMSARSARSAYITSAGPWSATFSPRSPLPPPRSGESTTEKAMPVSVKEIVTRTWTYTGSLEPAPKGKRRKTVDAEDQPKVGRATTPVTRVKEDEEGAQPEETKEQDVELTDAGPPPHTRVDERVVPEEAS